MKILITGGGGFLGSNIVRMLIKRGDTCRIVCRGDYPAIRELGVEQIRGDLADKSVANKAVEGCEAVFHVAAKAGIWGDYATYENANVIATQNITDACSQWGVKYLIHTSTPSVTFDGSDIEKGPQSLAYASQFRTHYAKTKAIAEKHVLAQKNFKVIALRPHLIYGPGDPHLLPRIIEGHKAGKMKQVGEGLNVVDLTYIENAAIAHIQALDAFIGGNDHANAKAYFISDDHPVNLWGFLNRSLKALGYPGITASISHKMAFRAGALLETFHKTFKPSVEPRMTRFVADNLATSHWYDMEPAQRDFGYKPIVDAEEGFHRMIKDLEKRGFAKT